MAKFSVAQIDSIVRKTESLIEVKVDRNGAKERAVAYEPYLDCRIGDRVLLNTTAVDLDLGSGGLHFIHCNLSRPEGEWRKDGHIMKLRYTSWQQNFLVAEEKGSPHHGAIDEASDIAPMKVLSLPLHSHLAPAVAVLKMLRPDIKVAYLHTDGAALPSMLSNTARELKDKELIEGTVTTGNAWGGDYEAINVYSGMAVARRVMNADVCVCAMGPGMTGTSTWLGFAGMEQASVVNAAFGLNGQPFLAPRISFADPRPRHRGISEQTMAVIENGVLAPAVIPVPVCTEPEQENLIQEKLSRLKSKKYLEFPRYDAELTADALDSFGLKAFSMGRGYGDDPLFFQAAGAAAMAILKSLED